MASGGGSLSGRTAIVTGGAHGIGRATALRLAEDGANVVVADINAAGASEAAEAIASAGGVANVQVVDVSAEDQVVEMVAETTARYGGIDILHNNAYASRPDAQRDIVSLSLETWNETINVCLTSQMLCCKHVIPAMTARGGGVIVNMASAAGVASDDGLVAYGVAKAGVLALTRAVATTHGRAGIRANSIAPGYIVTHPGRPQWWMEIQRDQLLVDGLGRPEDIAAIVAFLASDDARFIQGACIDANGGLLAHLPQTAAIRRHGSGEWWRVE